MSYAFPGYFVQMTNPKVALAWTAIIAIGLGEGAPLWVRSFHSSPLRTLYISAWYDPFDPCHSARGGLPPNARLVESCGSANGGAFLRYSRSGKTPHHL